MSSKARRALLSTGGKDECFALRPAAVVSLCQSRHVKANLPSVERGKRAVSWRTMYLLKMGAALLSSSLTRP